MTMDQNICIMVWASYQGRADLWGKRLDAPVYFIYKGTIGRYNKLGLPLRYLRQAQETWKILITKRPRVILVTNPPIFAGAIVSRYCKQSNAALILDTHSPALFSKQWRWTLPIQKLIARRAIVNILDQDCFKQTFESWGCRVVMLQRPPIRRVSPKLQNQSIQAPIEITAVNTFATDEPLSPILDAARELPDIHFSILGDFRLAPLNIRKNKPDNVTFTGYLRGNDYWDQLNRSQAILCLTTFSHSLLGGAQDGMMAEVPVILSRQPVLCEYFTRGRIFIENTAQGIIQGVNELKAKQDILKHEMITLRAEKQTIWEKNFIELRNIIDTALRANEDDFSASDDFQRRRIDSNSSRSRSEKTASPGVELWK